MRQKGEPQQVRKERASGRATSGPIEPLQPPRGWRPARFVPTANDLLCSCTLVPSSHY